MLQEWLSNNKERIENEYKETIGFEEKNYNGNLKILETGFRKDEAIALVEKDVPSMNRKEYIVAFNVLSIYTSSIYSFIFCFNPTVFKDTFSA